MDPVRYLRMVESSTVNDIKAECGGDELSFIETIVKSHLKTKAADISDFGETPDQKTIELTKKFVQLFPDQEESFINRIPALKNLLIPQNTVVPQPLYNYHPVEEDEVYFSLTSQTELTLPLPKKIEDKKTTPYSKILDKPLKTNLLDNARLSQLQLMLKNGGESVSLKNLEKLFPEIQTNDPNSPDVIPSLVSALLEYVKDNKQTLEKHPSEATRIHHIVNELAKKEILKGNLSLAFEMNMQIAETLPLPLNHPLHEMDTAINQISSQQKDTNLGANFSDLDTSLVKGGHLHAVQRTIDGKQKNCFDFKVSHYIRDEMNDYLNAITSNPQGLIQVLQSFGFSAQINSNGGQAYLIDVNGKFSNACKYFLGSAVEVTIENLGKITIGTTKEKGCAYNFIQVEMDANLPPGEGLKKLQSLLSAAGLGPVLGLQPVDSDERMKIAKLLRAYYPALATQLDTTKEFYELSLEDLKRKIISLEPKMRDIFKKYLEDSPDLMQKVEILPGKTVWSVADIGKQVKESGAWGLMIGVGNTGSPEKRWENTKEAITSILEKGAMSTEQRFLAGRMIYGASSEEDLISGGGDQVFTRMVTNNLDHTIKKYPLSGEAQVLIDFEPLANEVPYASYKDGYGVRNRFIKDFQIEAHKGYEDRIDYNVYANRDNLMTFSETVSNTSNEVMVKNTIGPKHIKGIVVSSEEKKKELMDHLLKKNVATKDENGVTYVGASKADDFIHVSATFQKEMWS